MYPHANTGNDDNNKKLSPCSTEIMGPILSIRATCFEGRIAIFSQLEPRVLKVRLLYSLN